MTSPAASSRRRTVTQAHPAPRRRSRVLGHVMSRCPICLENRVMEIREYSRITVSVEIETGDIPEPDRRLTCGHCPWSSAEHLPDLSRIAPRPADLPVHLPPPPPAAPPRHPLPCDYDLLERARRQPSSLSPQQRRDALTAPFALLADAAEFEAGRELGATPLNIVNAAFCLGGLFVAFVALLQIISPQAAADARVPSAGLMCAGILACSIGARHFITHDRRIVRRRMLPAIAQALRPLRPLDHEVVEALQAHRHRAIGSLKPLTVIEAIRANP